jgi:protein-L-isoaspartate(D-aspartate) O-methyltransferase
MGSDRLGEVRRAYAAMVLQNAHLTNQRLENALSEIAREDFLGAGPWKIPTIQGVYEKTPDDDPARIYCDKTVGIIPEKGLNNGQPSFLAYLISLGRPAEGDSVVHVGTGTGYYTAILARMVGDTGNVTAIEFEPALAARAKGNLAGFRNICVVEGDGCSLALGPSDMILVNAGATRPAANWLDALKDGGRLVLPLTVSFTDGGGHRMTIGSIFLIERDGDAYKAHWKSPTGIYPCAGMRDEKSEAALGAAFAAGRVEVVTRLYRTDDIPDERCWAKGPGWCLAFN